MRNILQQEITQIVKETSKYYQQLLGFAPRRTKLEILTKGEWVDFCNRHNFDYNLEGVFLPRNLTAYLLQDSENLILNLFHEFFGHGLFCEYSKQGKLLEKLEKRLKRDEKREFGEKRFSLQELRDFRQQNLIFRHLQQERERGLNLYETFAIWTEHYLSGLFGMTGRFKRKDTDISNGTRENLEKLLNFQKKFGEFALFYEAGMPKYYDIKKIRLLLEEIFKEKSKDSKLILLYGSRKPYSDIDLLVVSKGIENFSNEWLDIYSVTPEQFEYSVSVFDVSITDPLLTGELVLGNKDYLEQKRKQLQEQPITKEAIYYNLIKSKQQRILGREYQRNSNEYKKGLSYSETYRRNTLLLSQGKRKLTRNLLIQL